MSEPYTMRISRLTVDKLGVKLYDKVSAVIAELISNAYDADATTVSIHAPMDEYLARKSGGKIIDQGFEIVIEDDGVGMTPEEMQSFFLVVGAERRTDPRRSGDSRKFNRKVMGRKGVGKLAPFGICKIIEIISSGGDEITEPDNSTAAKRGYLTSHVILNYDDIQSDKDDLSPYQAQTGKHDRELRPHTGTKITLRLFRRRKVGDIDTLERQIAQRFGLPSENWKITLYDNTSGVGKSPKSKMVAEYGIKTMENTQINFTDGEVIEANGDLSSELKAGFHHDGTFYRIKGWVAYSKAPYKDDLMAGVRIYCRGKIAAQTAVFGRSASFRGELAIRSYLVGEIHADWLDDGSDLIQTDRQDILWSDDLCAAFQEWGQNVVKHIGKMARNPQRRNTMEIFLETGNVKQRILETFPRRDFGPIRERAMGLARMMGRKISPEEAKDKEAVEELVKLSISLAPHVTLDEKLKAAANDEDSPISTLSAILRTARVAELSSFGSIAEDRVKVIGRLERLKDQPETHEIGSGGLQELIEYAPWLVNPEWAPVTANQTFRTFVSEFQKFHEKKTGEKIELEDVSQPRLRPDFILSSQEGVIQIIEIKRPDHVLSGEEMDRIVRYHENMEEFIEFNKEKIAKPYSGFHITLVCDGVGLQGTQKAAYDGYLNSGRLTRVTWSTFLSRTKEVHRDFLKNAAHQKRLVTHQNAVRDAKDA